MPIRISQSRLTHNCYLDICLLSWLRPFLFCVGRVRDHSRFDEHLVYCPWLVTRHISWLWRPGCGPLYQVWLERHFQTITISISIYYCAVACEYSRDRNSCEAAVLLAKCATNLSIECQTRSENWISTTLFLILSIWRRVFHNTQ